MRRHIIMDERRFRHSSLRNPSTEIRVLELLPSLRDGIIQCRLRHVKLKCKYVALSYVWGPPQPTRDILVNGQMFAIRQNLWNFLEMQFETSQTAGVLYWIDQICVNQDNIEEKCEQVGLMSSIYSNAQQVLIWLGNEDEAILRHILEVKTTSLNLLMENYNELIVGRRFGYSPYQWQTTALRSLCDQIEAKLDGNWMLFEHLAYNGYWLRAWCLQEYVLATDAKILSRTAAVGIREFVRIYFAITQFHAFPDNPLLAFIGARRLKHRRFWLEMRRHKITLENVLVFFRNRERECTNVVDAIYSLLGLVELKCLLKPDYSRDARTLYRDALICEWYSPSSPRLLADLIAEVLKLDRDEAWQSLLRYLELDRDASEDHLEEAILRERSTIS